MSVAMLGLPLVSVLLPALFLAQDAVDLLPLIIVAVVVSYVASAHVAPKLPPRPPPQPAPVHPAPGPAGVLTSSSGRTLPATRRASTGSSDQGEAAEA